VKALWTPSAVVSGCELYRYRLGRTKPHELFPDAVADTGGRVLWLMLNPSRADGKDDDHTIRRCTSFTERWGFARFDVANLFAYRTPSPLEVLDAYRRGVDIVGPRNDEHILALAREATIVICAWGAHEQLGTILAAREVVALKLVREAGAQPHALGFAGNGNPKHPLARGKAFIPTSTEPQPWIPKWWRAA
jgi:hypothetical protein